MRTCQSCAIEQPLANFYRHSQGHNGRRSRCKGCEREKAQKVRAAKLAALKKDPEAYRAYRERRNSRDRERAAEGWRWTRDHGSRRTAVEEAKAAGQVGYTDWCEDCGSAAERVRPFFAGMDDEPRWLCDHCEREARHLLRKASR